MNESIGEKNSFGFATLVYGSGMIVTHTYERCTDAVANRAHYMRGRLPYAASEVLRFSDGRWREMSREEQTIAIHDEGETHMRDECGRCLAEVERVRDGAAWMEAVLRG